MNSKYNAVAPRLTPVHQANAKVGTLYETKNGAILLAGRSLASAATLIYIGRTDGSIPNKCELGNDWTAVGELTPLPAGASVTLIQE